MNPVRKSVLVSERSVSWRIPVLSSTWNINSPSGSDPGPLSAHLAAQRLPLGLRLFHLLLAMLQTERLQRVRETFHDDFKFIRDLFCQHGVIGQLSKGILGGRLVHPAEDCHMDGQLLLHADRSEERRV